MMVRPRRLFVACFFVCACSFALWACGAQSPTSAPKRAAAVKSGEVIAVIGDENLYVEDIQKRIEEQSPFVRARYADLDKKKEFLDNQVRFELLAAEAIARGYADDPEVKDAIKKLVVQKLTREEFDGQIKASDVADAELVQYYDAHKLDYDKPEMVRASVLLVAFGADKPAAKKRAEELQKKASDKTKIDDRNFFRELVAQSSTDEASKRAGGDLRYVSKDDVKGKYGDPATQWLFAAETLNDVSPVLETADGYLIVKRTGKRKAITRSFDQVKNQIRNVVFRDKRTAQFNTYVDGLKTKHGVKVYEDKLGLVKVSAEVPSGGMPELPRGHGAPDEQEELEDVTGTDPHAGMTPPSGPAAAPKASP